jgi:hypothetical protein
MRANASVGKMAASASGSTSGDPKSRNRPELAHLSMAVQLREVVRGLYLQSLKLTGALSGEAPSEIFVVGFFDSGSGARRCSVRWV